MTYAEAKAKFDEFNAAVERASKALQVFPKGPMGLTPDDVKALPEWRAARVTYANASTQCRDFTRFFLKAFGKEYRAERRARFEARSRAHRESQEQCGS